MLFVASVAAGILTLVACGDDAATPIPGGGSSGTGTSSGKTSSGSADDDTTTDDDTTGDDDDASTLDAAGVDCSTSPAVHKTDQGFFCEFYTFDAGGGSPDSGTGGKQNCGPQTVCCDTAALNGTAHQPTYCAPNDDPGNGPSVCAGAAGDFNSEWKAGTAWECGGASNCPNDLKCCAVSNEGADAGNYANVGKLSGTGAPPPACNAKLLFKSPGTRCLSACDPKKGQLEVCSSTDKCSDTAQKCQPVRTGAATARRDIGICQK